MDEMTAPFQLEEKEEEGVAAEILEYSVPWFLLAAFLVMVCLSVDSPTGKNGLSLESCH